MANPFERMSQEPAANGKKAKPSEFQSQSQCSAGKPEKKQIALWSALNLDGPRRHLATSNARSLACADKEKVTARSAEASRLNGVSSEW